MEVIGKPIVDNRIKASNVMIEMTLKEYYDLSKEILSNNEYQRRRVKYSSSVYSLLKEDLKKGCLMPSIVMAMSDNLGKDTNGTDLIPILRENPSKLIILDGLQRSYTIRDLIQEMQGENITTQENVYNNKIRIEVYVGINKLGILYRMLTLNTGQTPMSTRHQIEIIYADYAKKRIENLHFIREIDDQSPKEITEYKFRDVIEGFTSFLQGDYLTLERVDILDNIKSLEKLATIDTSNLLFESFIRIYHKFIKKLYHEFPGEIIFDEYESLVERPFGNNVATIFKKSQSLTGFGAAIYKLINIKALDSLDNLFDMIEKIDFTSANDTLKQLLIKLDKIRDNAKKIGNDQRLFFYHFYRKIFDKELDSFLSMNKAVEDAYTAYLRETSW